MRLQVTLAKSGTGLFAAAARQEASFDMQVEDAVAWEIYERALEAARALGRPPRDSGKPTS